MSNVSLRGKSRLADDLTGIPLFLWCSFSLEARVAVRCKMLGNVNEIIGNGSQGRLAGGRNSASNTLAIAIKWKES